MTMLRSLFALLTLSLSALFALGQGIEVANPTSVTDQNRTGAVPYTASMSTGSESVDLSSGNLSIRIPIVHVKGRGMNYDITLMFDGNYWTPIPVSGNSGSVWAIENRTYLTGVTGWSLNQPYITYAYSKPSFDCQGDEQVPGRGGNPGAPSIPATGEIFSNFVFVDDQGRKVPLNIQRAVIGCSGTGGINYADLGPDTNALGMWATAVNAPSNVTTLLESSGNSFTAGGSAPNNPTEYVRGYGMAVETDVNGNSKQIYAGGTDTIGRTPLSFTQDSSTQFHYTYYDANGNAQNIYVNLTTVSINTSFGVNNEFGYPIYETSGSIQTIQSIQLPNGTSYQFQYANGGFGDLTQITLPTGGTVSYQWATNQDADWSHRYVSQRTINDGVTSNTWNLSLAQTSIGGPTISTLTDPTSQHNQSVYTETGGNTTDVAVYAGGATGTPLRHYQIGYFGYEPPDGNPPNSAPGLLPNVITTTNEMGQVSQIQYDYDTFTFPWTECADITPDYNCAYNGTVTNTINATRGNLKAIREYDWGNGSPGPLLKQTIKTYLHDQNSSYIAANVVDRVATDSVYDGSQTCAGGQACSARLLSQTTYSYDQDGAGLRGRVTQVDKLISTSGTATATSHLAYDSFGNITSVSDPKGNTSTWSYTDAWAPNNGNCVPSESQSAYVTQTTNALNQTTSYTYTPCTGQAVTKRNPNDTAAGRNGLQIAYDLMSRITDVYAADGGHTHSIYNDSTPSVETQTYLTNSTYVDKLTTLDGLGRTKQSKLAEPSGTAIYVDTGYEQTGKVSSISNPYRATSDATYGTTVTSYDALGRKSIVTETDQSTLWFNYSGNATTSTDEAGKSTKQIADGLGRLTDAYEDPNGMNLHTHYVYDPLGNLLSAAQSGTGGETTRTRSFAYDALSRLLSSYNPETQTITYSYLTNGQYCSGDVSLPCMKQDARGTQISYNYDQLNRLTEKTAPGIDDEYLYDNASPYGFTSNNSIGRMVAFANKVDAATQFSYDPMGRIAQQGNTLPADCCGVMVDALSAMYDLAGNVISLTYPDGRQVTQSWDSASRLQTVGNGTNTQAYLESITYNADGSPNVTTYGSGVQQIVGENNRLQVASLTASTPVGNLAGSTFSSHTYCYTNCGSSTPNNGNILQIADALNSSRTQGFTYDNLNRIASFGLNGAVNQQYTIDSFGNLSLLSGGNAVTTFDPATNRINNLPCASSVPSVFDAGGNQLCDSDPYGAVRQYSYDSENRITQIAALNNQTPFVSYVYGADGARVRKSNAYGTYTEYVDFGGQPIAERDQTGFWIDYVYANGRRIAKASANDPHLDISAYATAGHWQWYDTGVLQGYTIKSGDRLAWRQYQSATARGGVDIFTTSGGNSAWTIYDQNGAPSNEGIVTAAWDSRVIDLSSLAGQSIANLTVGLDQDSRGQSSIDFADMSLISQDGIVNTVFNGQPIPIGVWPPTQSMQNPQESLVAGPVSGGSLLFYMGDHLGTTQMEFASGGWPVSSSQFLPFGGEINPQPTTNHYKFTGKERDTESGLDYFGARYYGSSMGRFMSPDPLGGHLELPQSLNKYAYVMNNPLTLTDPTGLDFNLQCSGSSATCQNGTQGTTATDANGKSTFTATVISNDKNGGLVDQNGNQYSANVSGAGVSFTQSGSNSSSMGTFVNGTNATTIQGNGALSGFTFNFTSSNMASSVSASGTFTYNGTASQAEAALGKAGFQHYVGDYGDIFHPSTATYDAYDMRSPGGPGGVGGGHVVVDEPVWQPMIERAPRVPMSSVPTAGTLDLGTHNPWTGGMGSHLGEVWNWLTK